MTAGTIIPPNARDDRQRRLLRVAELTLGELALDLEADDEEEHAPSPGR